MTTNTFKVRKQLASLVCLFYVWKLKKNKQKLRNEQGVIYMKRIQKKNFQLIYRPFLYNGLDPRVHLEDYLWKMSNIVGKNHRH